MKGLLKKDFLETFLGFRTLFLVLLLFAFVSFVNADGQLFLIYLVVLPVMMPTSMITIEEREKWHLFAGALPVSRKIQTLEKYVFALCMNLLGLACITIIMLARKDTDILSSLLMFGTIGLVLPAISLPVTFQFGAEKARYIYMCLTVLTILLSLRLQGTGSSLTLPSYMLMPAVAAVYAGSIFLSIKIAEKKEY